MNNYDYQTLYKYNYKQIPDFVFWVVFVFLSLGAIAGAVLLFINSFVGLGILTLLVGIAAACGLARLNSWLSAVVISQRIAVADSLLEISSNKKSPSTSAVDYDLPDL